MISINFVDSILSKLFIQDFLKHFYRQDKCLVGLIFWTEFKLDDVIVEIWYRSVKIICLIFFFFFANDHLLINWIL